MSFPDPLPIVLCGKNQTMANNFASAIEKDGYKVLQSFPSVDSAVSTLPGLFSSPTGPYAVVIGKGFSEEEQADIMTSCDSGDRKVAWLLPDDKKMTMSMKAKAAMTAGTALPGIVADRAVKSLKAKGVAPGKSTEKFEGGVFGF